MNKWEYFFVSCRADKGELKPWLLNGRVLKGWKEGLTIYQFANEMGEQGWELVGYEKPRSMIFKRKKLLATGSAE